MLMLLLPVLLTADYTYFRAAVAGGDVPTTWDVTTGENVAWSAALPGRGLSSPLVVGDRVFVTTCDGLSQERLGVHCFDDATGEKLWTRQFWATGRTASHNKTSNAAPTPASDGERVFAFWSSGDLVALDLKGNLQWVRGLQVDYPNASNSLGMSSSLVVTGGVVVAQCEADAQAVAVGVDAETGEDRWVIDDRPKMANWTSPLPAEVGGERAVLLQSGDGITAVRVADGEVLWKTTDGASTIPSSTSDGSVVFAPSNGLTAYDGSSGAQLWNNSKLSPSTASPIVVGDRVYTVNRSGVVSAADAGSGERAWQLRLAGPYSATPIVAAGRLYFVNERGVAQVVQPSTDEGEVVGEGNFDDTILATPAVRENALYVRSDSTLWKVARSSEPSK